MINEVHETLRAAVGGKVLDHHRFLFFGTSSSLPICGPIFLLSCKRELLGRTVESDVNANTFRNQKKLKVITSVGKYTIFGTFFRSF